MSKQFVSIELKLDHGFSRLANEASVQTTIEPKGFRMLNSVLPRVSVSGPVLSCLPRLLFYLMHLPALKEWLSSFAMHFAQPQTSKGNDCHVALGSLAPRSCGNFCFNLCDAQTMGSGIQRTWRKRRNWQVEKKKRTQATGSKRLLG